MPELDSMMLAIADSLDDRRLQLADVVVLTTRPTVLAAALVAGEALCCLPGCLLVAVGVESGGCLMCRRDARWLLVDVPDPSLLAVTRLAIRYYVVLTLAPGPAG